MGRCKRNYWMATAACVLKIWGWWPRRTPDLLVVMVVVVVSSSS